MGPQVTKFVETCQVLTPKRELLMRCPRLVPEALSQVYYTRLGEVSKV